MDDGNHWDPTGGDSVAGSHATSSISHALPVVEYSVL